MFNLTRSQVLFITAAVVGLIIGKLIKNYKIALLITLVLGLLIFAGRAKKR